MVRIKVLTLIFYFCKGQILKKTVGIIIIIITILLVLRHLYLYHALEIRNQMILMKGILGWKTLLIGGMLYMVLLSIPFFPGIELGWLLILLFDREGIFVIYLFTQGGFTLSFIIGRWFPRARVTARFNIGSLKESFGKRFTRIGSRLGILNFKFFQHSDTESVLNKFRYLILAILVNTPGNAIIGGGGGIGLVCGMTRSFSWKGFALTIALATLPFPILLLIGLIQVENLMR